MSSFIEKEILLAEDKKISYAKYMELALYHPRYGYYMKENVKVGKQGDFYTSSNIHRVFAKVFVPIFIDICEKENLPFLICEIGGGTGQFARDLLEDWRNTYPETFSSLHYIIVEASPFHRSCQKEQLKDFANVKYFEDSKELFEAFPHFEGIVFSNELFDAFPVHVVQYIDRQLFELFVSVNETGDLIEIKELCSNEALKKWLEMYGPTLTNNQRIEVPLMMTNWLKTFTSSLNRAAIFTIDYGYTKKEWSNPEHRDGSLRGYYQHRLIENPLLYPGEMDLTTHIHLDAVQEIGNEVGLETVFTLKQDQFLLKANILHFLQDNYDPNPFSEKSKQNRAIRTLISGDSMSRAFDVIVQSKNLYHTNKWGIVSHRPF